MELEGRHAATGVRPSALVRAERHRAMANVSTLPDELQ